MGILCELKTQKHPPHMKRVPGPACFSPTPKAEISFFYFPGALAGKCFSMFFLYLDFYILIFIS
jgi:hypothetical protein